VTAVLGISAFFHDSAAAVVVDGLVIAAAQEERFSRKKHDSKFPKQAIAYCLQQAELEIEDLDHVVFYEKPLLKFERILESYLAYAPRGYRSFSNAMPVWLKSKLYLSRVISRGLDNRYHKRIIFPEHHQSHAASAFFQSPFEQAAILTVDGVGEWATTTLAMGADSQIKVLKELAFPDSLGLLYSAFTYFCGFRVNGGEGKLMGLAPYGKPLFADLILSELVDLKSDGSFRLNQDYFNYCVGDTMTSSAFDSLFGGPPRVMDSAITDRERNLAASVQSVTETILLKMAEHAHAQTGMKNLCLAGGVALNCVANGRLLRESPFENVWVPSAPGDAGGAIGAALFVWHQLLDNRRAVSGSATPYLGPQQDRESIKAIFEKFGAVYVEMTDADQLFHSVGQRLASQDVVGWFQGRMEFGPRALGNRSILADPRNVGMKNILNQKIKFRESFRPFAPVVLAHRAADFFEVGQPSPWMSFASRVCDCESPTGGLTAVPGITHVDGSARTQTVTESENPRLHGLLREFERITDCPILINTSFNIRGEAMVCTAEDAYRCFMKSGLDVLVVNDFLLLKTKQPPMESKCNIGKTQLPFLKKMPLMWRMATSPIGWLFTNLILSLVFLLMVTPVGIVTRMLGRNSIGNRRREFSSYWKSNSEPTDKTRYFKQY
jgi:carbamoyltransferase